LNVCITTTGEDLLSQDDRLAWRALEAAAPVDGFAGQWVKLRAAQVSLGVVQGHAKITIRIGL
jgi:hypothetical protein